MRRIMTVSIALAHDLDQEFLSPAVADALGLTVGHVRGTSEVVRLVPRLEWLILTPPDDEVSYSPWLLVAHEGLLHVFVLSGCVEVPLKLEPRLDSGAMAADLLHALKALGARLSNQAIVGRRDALAPRRSLGEVMRGPDAPARKGWVIHDPVSGQTLALWRLEGRIVAVWLTYSNESPFLTQHRIYWNGAYGLHWSDPPRYDLLITAADRLRLSGDQRRRWDYFFPPLTERLPHNLRIARRDATVAAIGEWVWMDRCVAAAAAVIGVGLTVLGGTAWAAAVLALAALALLMRTTLGQLAFGPPDPAAGPRRWVGDRRVALSARGGLDVHDHTLLNHFRPPPGPQRPARTLRRALLEDLSALSRFQVAAMLAAGVMAAVFLLRLAGVAVPDGAWVPAPLLVMLGADQALGWGTLWKMKRTHGGPMGEPATVSAGGVAAGVIGVLLVARGAFALAGFALVALSAIGRTLALLRFREQLEEERDIFQGELDGLLAQVPTRVPTDEEIDAWMDADLAELDRRSVDELHIDPACLTPVDGRLVQTVAMDGAMRAELDGGRVPPAVRVTAGACGVQLTGAATVLRAGKQWAVANGGPAYTLTSKNGALHLYAGEDLNPLALKGVPILGWGQVQPPDTFGKDRLARDHPHRLSAWRVGADGRLRHAVYYVQFLYFADRMLAGSGFFYDFITGMPWGRERSSNLEYPYRNVVGVQDAPVKNDALDELLSQAPGTLATTLFQLQVVNGHSIRIALTDEFVLKRVKESFRLAARNRRPDEEEQQEAGLAAVQPRSFLDAEEEDTDAARSKAVINYVKNQWRVHGQVNA